MKEERTFTILIAEDDTMLRETMTVALEAEGFKVIQAVDGIEMKKLATEKKPDLMLVDIQMPNKSGLEAIIELRAESDWGKKAKALVLTNVGDVSSIAKAFEAGTYDYLIKADTNLEDIIKISKQKLSL